MLTLINEFIHGNMLIREYSRDGKTVSHRVETPVDTQHEDETVTIPKDPIKELRDKTTLLEKAIEDLILYGGAI